MGQTHIQFALAFPLLFDTTSLGRDYLDEVVSIEGRAHIVDVGSSPFISRSDYENMCPRPYMKHVSGNTPLGLTVNTHSTATVAYCALVGAVATFSHKFSFSILQ